MCHQTRDPRWGHLGAHSALGEFVDEDVRMRRQLDHLRAAVGTQHPEVAEMLQVLAECHAANGDHGLAVGALREALAIYAKHGVGKRGELAPRAAQARQALATAYLALNRPLDAEREMAAAGESFDAVGLACPEGCSFRLRAQGVEGTRSEVSAAQAPAASRTQCVSVVLRLAQPAAVAVKAEDGGAEEAAADGGDGDLPPPDALALAADVDDARGVVGVVGDVDDDDVLGAVDLLDVPIDGPLLADGADGFEFAAPPFDGDGDDGGGGDASEDDVRCQACRGRHVRHTCGKGKHGRPKKGAAKAKGGAAAARAPGPRPRPVSYTHLTLPTKA